MCTWHWCKYCCCCCYCLWWLRWREEKIHTKPYEVIKRCWTSKGHQRVKSAKTAEFPLQLKTENMYQMMNGEEKIYLFEMRGEIKTRYALIKVMCWTFVVESHRKKKYAIQVFANFLYFKYVFNFEYGKHYFRPKLRSWAFCWTYWTFRFWFQFEVPLTDRMWSQENSKLRKSQLSRIMLYNCVFILIGWNKRCVYFAVCACKITLWLESIEFVRIQLVWTHVPYIINTQNQYLHDLMSVVSNTYRHKQTNIHFLFFMHAIWFAIKRSEVKFLWPL